MYSKRFDEKVTTGRCNEDYDLCNTEGSQRYIIQWSPQDRGRFLSKNRYLTPRALSKSLPVKNRGIVRYNINRSLNFDVGSRTKINNFNSLGSSSGSNVPTDNDNYLFRSAKILRALNIDYSPLKIAGVGTRKINKSLNFDSSPSPTRLVKLNKNPRNASTQNLFSPMSKINKTLNFETSSGESNVNSTLNSSVESMDENQNQTQFQRKGKAKKSLNYPPIFQSNSAAVSDMKVHSPMLRSHLKKEIDIIIQSKMIPHLQSSGEQKFDVLSASSPRNLFNDCYDGDCDEEEEVNVRPQTPVNFIKIVPESMNAIKKSHKKERVLGRLGKAIAYQTKSCSGDKYLTDIHAMDDCEKLMTPLVISGCCDNLQGSINSTEKSRKTNEQNKKLNSFNTEDDITEAGSLFDYSEEATAFLGDKNPLHTDKDIEFPEIHEELNCQLFEEDEKKYQNNSDIIHEGLSSAGRARLITYNDTPYLTPRHSLEMFSDNFKAVQNVDQIDVVQGASARGTDTFCARTIRSSHSTIKLDNSTSISQQPGTPENPSQPITTDLIESYTKIKVTNKKLLFKTETSHPDADEDIIIGNADNEDLGNVGVGDRAATPDNTNSSRLLLSQFSSVKKSHRKDKHRRMVSGSLQRKKFSGRENEAERTSDHDIHTCSDTFISDFPSLSPTEMSSESAVRVKSSSDISPLSSTSSGVRHQFLKRSPLNDNACAIGGSALLNSRFRKSSFIKRKNFSDDSSIRASVEPCKSQGLISMPYESSDEEFKIFTPIKKRRSLNSVAPIIRKICDSNDSDVESNKLLKKRTIESTTTTYSTPTSSHNRWTKRIEKNLKTPDRNPSIILSSITDYSTPVLHEIENSSNDSNSGRLTPQNQQSSPLMVDINAIKKSHKKDKRDNVSRRSLICAREEEYESILSLNVNNHSSKSQIQESPRLSTNSKNHRAISTPENLPFEQTHQASKTPPNCSKAVSYLKLLQTDSIKRSHKKDRERKKYKPIVMET